MRSSSDKQVGILTYQLTIVNKKTAKKFKKFGRPEPCRMGLSSKLHFFDEIRTTSDELATEHTPVPALPWRSQVQAEDTKKYQLQ